MTAETRSGICREPRLRQFLLPVLFFLTLPVNAEIPANFRRENLVAWCIVPFDAKARSPRERAEMLGRLGLKRVAYDWRDVNVAEFESEFRAYRDHAIELVAFWSGHKTAYPLFAELGVNPQIWLTLQTGKGLSNKEKIANAAESLVPVAKETAALGLSLGLYNQGGWGGLPDNLVSVCETLHEKGFDHVGIVYNFHHAHPRIGSFPADLAKMLPHLLCVTLNGMADPVKNDVSKKEHRIRPLGAGDHEATMIGELVSQGYEGSIAVIGHVANRDVEEVLRGNLAGLEQILKTIP